MSNIVQGKQWMIQKRVFPQGAYILLGEELLNGQ